MVSVLALSSRFDGRSPTLAWPSAHTVSVLALSSRFDGRMKKVGHGKQGWCFSTRSVESF